MESTERETITVAEVSSGKIELVFVDQLPVLQFNCSCEDALPYCNALCCRRRPDYNMALEGVDEMKRFADSSIRHPTLPLVRLMAYKDGACIHLDGCKCAVHAQKPSICKRWHCSPGGIGEGIEIRDGGFSFVTVHGDLQHEMINGLQRDSGTP